MDRHPHRCPLDQHTFRPFTTYHQRGALGFVFRCVSCGKLKIVTVAR